MGGDVVSRQRSTERPVVPPWAAYLSADSAGTRLRAGASLASRGAPIKLYTVVHSPFDITTNTLFKLVSLCADLAVLRRRQGDHSHFEHHSGVQR